MSLPDALMFQVGLIDRISKPIANIQRQFGDFGREYRSGTHTMIAGAAGVAGAGFALQAALMPAIEMDRALGEVKALGVADEALSAVAKEAMFFSAKYGQAAVDVVRHSETITNYMGQMPGHVLASVSRSSATLAMAMKSDADTVGVYMKTLYGNYQQQADAMGKDVWAAQVAGMTAEVKKLYGTNMDQLAGMVDGMHSLTSKLGVGLPEQLAVLGMLNTQMGEGDAVTQYTNFLEGAIGAQEKLGVSLVDSRGELLPMMDILNKIKPLIAGMSGLEARDLLDSAGLGDGSLMLMSMIEKTERLSHGINALGKVKGMDAATKMAATMTDQWQRLEQGLNSIRIAFGYAVMPAVLEVVSALSNGAQTLVQWTTILPNITRYIGYAVIGFFGLVAAGGMFTLMMGLGKQAMVGYMMVAKTWSVMNLLLTSGLVALRTALFGVYMMMVANPIFLIVAAVVATIAAIGALVYYWDDLKASFGDTTWFPLLEGVITLMTALFMAAFEFVKGGWQWVMSGFTDTSGFNGLFAVAEKLRGVFGAVFGWITEQFGKVWSMAKSVMSLIPGMGDDDETGKSKSVQKATPRASIPQGGAARNIASYTSASTSYGPINMNVSQMNSPQDFASEMEMVAG
ncbi:phage tail tape measure protein [Photobacterium kishitanii]|uniref:Phage tail tape measure protein n=1 Tax=Photobacterium kishitanii TaxID=318456 RepID=A0A2T3KJ47_9GAMM|nr:phage tail tape measure protein [Photobacterium kishitanii]PSU99297.1 phage tail tape measure protein [Photobacterium kishitanii]